MRVVVVVGTRPEAIKMAPVIRHLRQNRAFEAIVVSSGQHRQMLAQALDVFGIRPDYDLGVMRPNQTLSGLTAAVLERFDALLEAVRPDRVLVHGDTTTAMAATVAAFHKQVPVGHVEAGLRTGDLTRPFPEELNRRCIDEAADMLWTPTLTAKRALWREGLSNEKILLVTGNTVIDALLWAAEEIDSDANLLAGLHRRFAYLDRARHIVLVTGHRRESFGDGFQQICLAIRDLAARADVQIVYPVHLNPNVFRPVHRILDGADNVHLIEPQDYLSFVYLMKCSDVILTDSGGVQEEAPSLGKPVIVMRDLTERPEAVAAGTVQLTGADRNAIVAAATGWLDDRIGKDLCSINPYGDGRAAERIAASLLGDIGRIGEWDTGSYREVSGLVA